LDLGGPSHRFRVSSIHARSWADEAMSRFIKSHEEIAAARNEARRAAKTGAGAGFTEAELEAASWARRLPEVQLQIGRKTNGEKRSLNTKGADLRSLVRSNSLRGGAVPVVQENPEPLLPDLPGKKPGKEKTKKEKKEKKSHEKKKKKEKREKKEQGEGIETGDGALAQMTTGEMVSSEVGLLEAKSLEMKKRRKIAKEMRREQRRLKREERERFRQEQEELEAAFQDDPGLQDAIDNLIQVVQQERPAKAEALDAPEAEGQAPFRSLEELVAQLDELEKSEAGLTKPISAPHDPLNPLNAAYDMRAYEMLRKLRLDEEHQMSQVAADEPEWDHLGYLRRSPSPCRLRTNGTMWPTRKGAWRSRAGGVYLPPEAGEVERRGSASLSPAKWMYPEEFNRPFKEARRSPSYNRFDREEISSTSSSSSSTVPKRRKKRRRLRSSSHESRPSPEYLPEA